MLSNDFLKEMESARLAHIKWLQRVQRLIENMPVSDSMIPLNPVQSGFGHWLYSNGLEYKELARLTSTVENIKKYHEKLHYTYVNIYKIYFVDSKRSWLFSKLLSTHKEIPSQQQNTAYKYFEELQDISQKLIKEFDSLHRNITRVDIKILRRATH